MRRAPLRTSARKFLLSMLCSSESHALTVEEIRTRTTREGFKWITVRRAKKGLCVARRRGGMANAGYWVWELTD